MKTEDQQQRLIIVDEETHDQLPAADIQRMLKEQAEQVEILKEAFPAPK